ncbi:hypothetical protein ACKWTF_004213 [Chironomus riparius]
MDLRNNSSLIENINIRKLIQTLNDIKSLKESYPKSIEVAVKSNYTQIKISKQLKYDINAEMELCYAENNWIIMSHNFPEKAASSLLKIGSSTSLKSAVEGFLLLINNLKNYFESLYILDLNCIVLEPYEKLMSINWRLIKYSKFAFIKIEFLDPLDVNNFNVTFYGKDHVIKELNEAYNTNSYYDEDETDIYQKLCIKLKILEFPYTNRIEDSDECSICLCQHNEQNESPIVCCENPRCDQLFHASCLNQHLNINSYKVLSVAVGECPFCKQKISSNFSGFMKKQQDIAELNRQEVMVENSMSITNKMDTQI